ncbi:MAG: alcohol dehydrogenase catalytic domain-containing protein [Anaerolineales bacterium]|nr:alcohol dehydrogenase catalytic domain-containing protein [Anaerolineales bacterium]
MLAAVYHGPNDLRLEHVPEPSIGPGDLLMKVVAAGICGTDLRIIRGDHRKFPIGTVRIPGHEIVGTIQEVGSEVKGFVVGQVVFIAPNIGCGHCRECVSGSTNLCGSFDAIGITLDGGFAEYLRVPATAVLQGNVMPLNTGVDPAAAAMIEPFACVLRGQDAIRILPGEVVLVMGAGPIGVMHVKLARLRGAGRILVSEPFPRRAAQISSMGADRVVNPTEEDLATIVAEETRGRGAEVVIVAAPVHSAQESALHLAGVGGRILFFGGLPKDRPRIAFDSNLLHYKELVVTGTTACSTGDCLRATAIVNSGRIDLSDVVSHRFSLAAAADAFATAESRDSLKVILEP